MRLRRLNTGFRATAPCKINLHLEVLSRRSDGYHDIETVMMPISLSDDLDFYPDRSGDLSLKIESPCSPGRRPAIDAANGSDMGGADNEDPAWQIPEDGRNLVLKAASAVRSELVALSPGDADLGGHFVLHKRTPAAAGLGGGSSDAASAIVISMLAWTGRWDRELGERVASRLGSDINFFLGQANKRIGMAKCTGRGEQVESISASPDWSIVLVHPPAGCSTAAVYRNCVVPDSPNRAAHLLHAIDSGQWDEAGRLIFNRLQSPAREINDWVQRTLDELQDCCPLRFAMSGSGSACFAIARHTGQARRWAGKLKTRGFERVHIVTAWQAPSLESQIRQFKN